MVSDIPADIREMARELVSQVDGVPSDGNANTIALALLAMQQETARVTARKCRNIARGRYILGHRNEAGPGELNACRDIAEDITALYLSPAQDGEKG